MMNPSDVPLQVPGRAGTVDLVAGVLCLDFVNTLDPRVITDDGTIPRNYLTSYEELIAWGRHVDILSAAHGQALLRSVQQHPEGAQAAIEQTLLLRETIYDIFFAIALHREIRTEALQVLKQVYDQAIRHAHLTQVGQGFGLIWRDDSTELLSPLWPIASSAIELLLHGEQERIKECPSASEGCGWLFYDTSKNNSRRWCSMRTCGMQSKDRRRGKRARPSKPIGSV